MINLLSINRNIADWQQMIEQLKRNLSDSKTINNYANPPRVSQQISKLKQELDRSFPEFGDVGETLATYKLYRQLESLQQQIKSIEE